MLENDLEPGVVGVDVTNADVEGVAAMLRHPAAIISNSDAGAHLQMMCASGDTTLLLTRHVRERGDFTLEDAVWQLTGRQATIFGMPDRGVLRPGAVADVTVFALDELHWDKEEFVTDLPGGGPRFRRPGGWLPLHRRRRRRSPRSTTRSPARGRVDWSTEPECVRYDGLSLRRTQSLTNSADSTLGLPPNSPQCWNRPD